jgi:hypothetical protein
VDLHLFKGKAPLLKIPELGHGQVAIIDVKLGGKAALHVTDKPGKMGAAGRGDGEDRAARTTQPKPVKLRGNLAHLGVAGKEVGVVLEADARRMQIEAWLVGQVEWEGLVGRAEPQSQVVPLWSQV